jgi:capsid assembly protease
MEFRDFYESPWAVEPKALDSMMSMLPRLVTPENISAESLTAGPARDEYTPELTITRNVAVIPLSGYLSKRQTLFSFLMGGGNLNRFAVDLDAAVKDRRVRGIVLYVDSPGGPVSMIPDICDLVYRARDEKPIVTYSDGVMMSGGYWVGSSAHKIILSPVAEAGSIGVLMVHADWSKWNDEHGIKYTWLTAGKYKAEGNEDTPLSEPARRRIEGRLQDLYTVFVDAVARNRAVSATAVRADMAEGRIFVGQRAVDAGLADQVGDLDAAIDMAGSGDPAVYYQSQIQPEEEEIIMPNENVITTLPQLHAAYPDLCRELSEQAAADALAAAPDSDAAVSAETDRLLALAMIHFGDDAEKFQAIVKNGITADQYQSMAAALLPAQPPAAGETGDPTDTAAAAAAADPQVAQMLAAIQATGAPAVGAGGTADGELDFSGQVRAAMESDSKMTKAAAIAQTAEKYPKLHAAYLKKVNATPESD